MVIEITAPLANPETESFWKACNERKLLYKFCNACREPHYYPRTHCPFCFSDETVWKEASGEGTIYTYSVMRAGPEPYAVAFVTLAEGPTLFSNIVDSNLDNLQIGKMVRLSFRQSTDGPLVPMFTCT